MRLHRLLGWARIQKVLFPISKKRVQFSVDRSLNASKLAGKGFFGPQGSSVLPANFYKRPLRSCDAS